MTMPPRLTEVGDLERVDHTYLPPDAQCYFWGEYTPYEHTNGLKWDYSPTNRLIANFKKKLDRADRPEWRDKQEAILNIALSFSRFWRWAELHGQHHVALIPIPPSKGRDDPMFDPRMFNMLTLIADRVGLPLDIRDCFSFSGDFSASHDSDNRPSPDELYNDLNFNNELGRPNQPPGIIFLFDDMLTTGAHYVALSRKLAEIFPGVAVIGNFIARRCVQNPFEDLE